MNETVHHVRSWAARPALRKLTRRAILGLIVFLVGCSSDKVGKKEDEFFTSGSREGRPTRQSNDGQARATERVW